MSAEDRLEEIAGSVLDGRPVDWHLAETESGADTALHGLRDLEQIATYNRILQRLSESPAVAPPEQWGHLTLLERASAGKSGEIWRAWDSWLQREVALKFLLGVSEGTADESALLEEARALARVRHPAVVAIYGISEHGGRVGMWMEMLTGNSLEVEIARRGPLPPEEVRQLGLELCRALEAVGTAGLVHRDIKPANIMLESSGRIVLTDFGLGRRLALDDTEPWRSSGTPLFMSPERLAGEPATPRSDLYALGVTLRWALTGRCPFRSRTIEELRAETQAGVRPLREERPDTPAFLAEAIERAMAPRVELRTSGAVQLGEALREASPPATPRQRPPLWRRAVAVAGIIAITAAGTFALMPHRGVSPPAARFSIQAPPNTTFFPESQDIAVSPDGRLLAFMAIDSSGSFRLWLRPLGSLTARALEGTTNAVGPFWSPDSRYLGFFADSKLLKIPVSGGPAEVICAAHDPRGATWGANGVIVFAPDVAGPLCRVSAEGGPVTVIQRPDSTRHETALRWPEFFPDGKRFFFAALPPRDGDFEIYAASVDSKKRVRVMSAGCAPIPAGGDGIITANSGRLMFHRFDYRTMRPIGSPVALGIAPFADVSVGQPLAAASFNGVLAHAGEDIANTSLTWLDRAGKPRAQLPLPPGRYEQVFIAPDGKRLLVQRRDSPTTVDLLLVDLQGGGIRRFSQGSQTRLGGHAVWSPDGRRIAFNSNRSGRTYIYERSVDEAAEEHLLYQSPGQFNEVLAWSPDGRYLVFQQAGEGTAWDLWLLPLDGTGKAVPYLRTRFSELDAAISPDGRWLAYITDANGRAELHVRSFPVPGVEHVVSDAPGAPFWTRRDELIISRMDGIWSLPISTDPVIRAGEQRLLVPRRQGAIWHAIGPLGDRFIESFPAPNSEPLTLTVDQNFLARIKP